MDPRVTRDDIPERDRPIKPEKVQRILHPSWQTTWPLQLFGAAMSSAKEQLVQCRFGRLIRSGWRAEGDCQAVPAVDCNDCEGEVDQFLLAEVLAGFVVSGIRHL